MSGWKVVPLGFCASEVRNKNIGGREKNLLSLSYGNIVRKDIDATKGLLPGSFDTYNIVEAGDTVLRLTDLQNDQRSLRVGLVNETGIITSAYVSIRPRSSLDARFLNYYLKNMDFRKDFYALGAGVRQSLRFEELRRIAIPVPPMHEQRAIADYLDIKTVRIDALIAKKIQMKEVLEEREAAERDAVVLSVAGGPTCSLRWLLREAISDGPHETPEFVDEGVPFLSVDNIVDSQVVFDGCRMISKEDHVRYCRKLRPGLGDVLITKAASVGKVALVDDRRDFNIWSPIAVLRTDKSVLLPEFLWQYLRTRMAQRELSLGSTSNTQQNISMRDLGSLRVPVVSIQDQRKACEQLSEEVRGLLNTIEDSVAVLRERRQALITAAVTGQIEVPQVAA